MFKGCASIPSGLKFQEQAAAALFLCIIFILILFALRVPEDRWPRAKLIKKTVPSQIVVWFSGAFEQEGRYHFPQGTTLREALRTLEIKDYSHIEESRLDRPLKTGQRIKIKKMNNPLVNN